MESEIIKEYEAPEHCMTLARFVTMLYDGGWGDAGAYMFWQCEKCKKVLKTRIKDAKTD